MCIKIDLSRFYFKKRKDKKEVILILKTRFHIEDW